MSFVLRCARALALITLALGCSTESGAFQGSGMDASADAPRPDVYTGCLVGAEETCNGRDDDCDTRVDETFDLQTSLEHCGA